MIGAIKASILFVLLATGLNLDAAVTAPHKYVEYSFTNDPIDVVITSSIKDIETLNFSIDGIRKNGANIRRIIVVSEKKLTDEAEWFDAAKYPFSKEDVAAYLYQENLSEITKLLSDPYSCVEVYYHQLLRLYACQVIEGLSPNCLILDPDTIFLNPVSFLNGDMAGLYDTALLACKDPIAHARRLIPNFKRAYYVMSGQVKHMLFQKSIMNDLFDQVESHHKMKFWEAYCQKIDTKIENGEGASEYEIYFNFAFSRTKQVKLRKLKYMDVIDLSAIAPLKEYGYDYLSCSAWKREWLKSQMMSYILNETETTEDNLPVTEPSASSLKIYTIH